MNIALWVIQLLLAVTFLASGVNKLARPRLAMVGQLPYVEDLSDAQIKGIGALELLAVIGRPARARRRGRNRPLRPLSVLRGMK
jgi:uncharacterized membrane protein YphA (DoxX/SURF4 family)